MSVRAPRPSGRERYLHSDSSSQLGEEQGKKQTGCSALDKFKPAPTNVITQDVRRLGTFVKENDEDGTIMSDIIHPRIKSSDKRSSQVIRTDNQNNPKEANYSIVRGSSSVSENAKQADNSNTIPEHPVLHKASPHTTDKVDAKKMAYDSGAMIRKAAKASDPYDPEDDSKIIRLTAIIDDLTERLQAAEHDNKQLRADNNELQETVALYREKYEKTAQEIQLLNEEWTGLAEDLKHSQTENSRLHQQVQQNDELVQKLQQELEHLVSVKENLEKMQEHFESAKSAYKRETDALNERIRELEYVEHDGERKTLENQKQIENELADLKQKNADLLQEIEKLKTDNEQLSVEVQHGKSSIETVHAENRDLIERNESLQKSLTVAQAQCSNFQKESATTTEDLSVLQRELAELRRKCNELEEENERLRLALQAKQKECEHAIDVNNKLAVDNSGLQDRLNKLMESNKIIGSLERERNEYKSKYETSDRTAHELRAELDQVRQQLREHQRSSGTAGENEKQLRQQLEELTEERSRILIKVRDMESSAANSKASMTSMSEIIREKQSHIEDLRREVMSLRETNKAYLEKLNDTNSKHVTDADVLKSKLGDIEGAHKKLLDENKRLRTLVAHHNIHSTENNSDIKTLRGKLETRENELAAADERIATLEQTLEELSVQVEHATSKNTNSYLSVYERDKMLSKIQDRIITSSLRSSSPSITSSRETASLASNAGAQVRSPVRSKAPPRTTVKLPSEKTALQSESFADHASYMRQFRNSDGYKERFHSRPTNWKKLDA